MATASCAADLVAAGVQDSCDDACSICLDPFSLQEPPTWTACNHSFHLQCVLEWAQRRPCIECPMCWQPLALRDPAGAALLASIEAEAKALRPASAPAMFAHYTPQGPLQFPEERHLEHHLLHHLAAAVSRSRQYTTQQDPLARTTGFPTLSSSPPPAPLPPFSSSSHVTPTVRRSLPVPLSRQSDNAGEAASPSPLRTGAGESFKARLAAATRGYKETAAPKITKGFRWLLSAFHSSEDGAPSSAPSASLAGAHGRTVGPSRPQVSSGGDSPPALPTASSQGGPSAELSLQGPQRAGHRRSTSNLTRELQKMALDSASEQGGNGRATQQ